MRESLGPLVDAITFLVASAPVRLGRTKLQKLLYLADLEAYRQRGRTITGLTYIAYDHGPWLRELYEALEAATAVRERRYLWNRGDGYEYVIDPEIAEPPEYLDESDLAILRETLEQWGRKPLGAILNHVYSHGPYTGTPFGEAVPLEASS